MGENIDRPQMDIVLVSNGRNSYLRNVTINAIQSCKDSSNLVRFNFLVIEQDKRITYNMPGVKTIHYDFDFNYNKCLNLGIKHSKTRFIALCNNDLDFQSHWAEFIVYAMGDKYLSGSPAKRQMGPGIVEGYTIAREINGWCIVINRALLEKIGKLDEGVKFWYSDNIYADQLRQHGIKHILVKHSVVRHLNSLTLKTDRNGRDLMRKQYKYYIKARQKYLKPK